MFAYPLKPVITSSRVLPQLYDQHPESLALVSSCISLAEAHRLLDAGAEFEAVLVLDDAPRKLMQRLANPGTDTAVMRIRVAKKDGSAVKRIHKRLAMPQTVFHHSGG